MTTPLTPDARVALAAYEGAPLGARLHTQVRWRTCPFPAVAAHVPLEGRVLEVGCGHGLFAAYLAVTSPRRAVRGTDLDPDKIDVAGAAAARLGETVDLRFALAPSGHVPEGPWDAIAVVDVLYLLPPDDQHALLTTCAAALAPGGVLLVKEMATVPAWKARWNRTQETLSVKVLDITAGNELHLLPPAEMAGWLRDEGLDVSEQSLHRGYLHPHHLVIGRRP